MNSVKKRILTSALALLLALVLAACGSGGKDDLPDILQKTVGTEGDVYFTTFEASGDTDYRSFFAVTFENTTEADYTELLAHYQSESTGTDEDGALLFSWGRIQIDRDEGTIAVNAYIS